MGKYSDLYCNPAPLPELPLGMDRIFPGWQTAGYTVEPCDYREVADPEILPFEGKYYCYVSCRQVYVSSDLIHWEYCPIEIDFPLGYAPAVTRCGDNIYLTCSPRKNDSMARIYAGKHPLGPFKTLGAPKDKNGKIIEDFLDPALFTDDDGRVYLYWGCTPVGGAICGMEVDPERPDQGISDIVKIIEFDPANEWEHFGQHGEMLDFGWDEGASMYKYNGIYYLQYASCGTRFPAYGIGVYMLKSPLEVPQKPAVKLCGSRNGCGIVGGTGHGGMFTGPAGKTFQAYSVLVRQKHIFERRIGIDPVVFDANGVPSVHPSSVPQSVSSGDVGLVNGAAWKNLKVSSLQSNSMPLYAVDECPHTAWYPSADDREPTVTLDLEREFVIPALRIIFSEQNLDVQGNVPITPVRYKVEFLDKDQKVLEFVLDKTANTVDSLIEFSSFAPVFARYVRLKILRGDSPLIYGITDLAVFVEPRNVNS